MPTQEVPLVAVPIPAPVETLAMREAEKEAPLTEAEALRARNECTCVALPISDIEALVKSRGGRDLDLENCWQEWHELRGHS